MTTTRISTYEGVSALGWLWFKARVWFVRRLFGKRLFIMNARIYGNVGAPPDTLFALVDCLCHVDNRPVVVEARYGNDGKDAPPERTQNTPLMPRVAGSIDYISKFPGDC